MARWLGISSCLASAILLVGCIGGQTGEPASAAPCESKTVSRDQLVDGVSPAELARAFEGRHTAPLRWLASSSRDGGTPHADDEIAVTVTYQGADGSTCDDLEVEVVLDVATRDSGVMETRKVNLVAPLGDRDAVRFVFDGARVEVDGSLQRVNGVVTLSGRLQSIDGTGPNAEFPPGSANGSQSPGAP